MKNINSNDPKKKEIVRLFKEKTGAVKVTLVKEDIDNFEAHCLARGSDRKFESLGIFKLEKEDYNFYRSKNIIKIRNY